MAKRSKPIEDSTPTNSIPPETTTPPSSVLSKAATAGGDHVELPPQGDNANPLIADPRGILTIALSGENGGPRIRLLRSNKFQQMQIQFDDKPDEAVRIRLNSEGWKWRTVEKVWSKQLDPDARWRTEADAEKLVKEIGDTIRAERGLSATLEISR